MPGGRAEFEDLNIEHPASNAQRPRERQEGLNGYKVELLHGEEGNPRPSACAYGDNGGDGDSLKAELQTRSGDTLKRELQTLRIGQRLRRDRSLRAGHRSASLCRRLRANRPLVPACARVGGPPRGGSSGHPPISNLKFQISKKNKMTQIRDERTYDDPPSPLRLGRAGQGNFRTQVSNFNAGGPEFGIVRISPHFFCDHFFEDENGIIFTTWDRKDGRRLL